jgi:putative salt-induced outer membrane protein YdiY
LEKSHLVFNTPYAGEISVKWEDVVNLKTDAPVKVMMDANTVIEGIISPGEAGQVTVKAADIQDPIAIEIARLKVINPKPPEPALKTNVRANFGASFTSGNTETENIYGDGELVARTEINRYTLGAIYKRSESDEVETADSLLAYMKYDHFLTKKWFFYANATGEKDKFKDLDFRTSAGVGSGYQFLETDRTRLSLEAGLSYVSEDFITAEDADYAAGRWGLRFEHFLLEKSLQFFHHNTGLQSLENSDDLVIYTQTGFRVPLYKNLNTSIQFNYDYDKSPAPGTKKEDKAVIVTLGYQWDG